MKEKGQEEENCKLTKLPLTQDWIVLNPRPACVKTWRKKKTKEEREECKKLVDAGHKQAGIAGLFWLGGGEKKWG